VAGGAVLLQRVTAPRPPRPPAVWRREPIDEEIDDVVLR
jgi:hypothetical protein